jgi:hypothetical protein
VKELVVSGVLFSAPIREAEADSLLDTSVFICPPDGSNPPMAATFVLVSTFACLTSGSSLAMAAAFGLVCVLAGELHPDSSISRTISIRSCDVKGAPTVTVTLYIDIT